MKGLKLTKITKVSLSLTADDWQLYDVFGRDDIARYLNKTLEANVNAGVGISEIKKVMQNAFDDYPLYGANDSEPKYLLDVLLLKIFSNEVE
jgi:hypothetical protein